MYIYLDRYFVIVCLLAAFFMIVFDFYGVLLRILL